MTEEFVHAGFRGGWIFALDTTYGLPSPVDDLSLYEGIEVYGAKGFTPPGNEPRRIVHTNADRVGQTQLFPSLEPMSGEVTIDASDFTLLSTLSGVNIQTTGAHGATYMPHFTEKQGAEIAIGLILYQAAITRSGLHVYHTMMIPNATASPVLAPFADGQQDMKLSIAANVSTKHLYGPALTVALDGVTEAAVIDYYSPGPLHIGSWIADGVETDFDFHTDRPASDALYTLYHNTAGTVTLISAGITKLVTGIDYDVAPADGLILHAVYEKDV